MNRLQKELPFAIIGVTLGLLIISLAGCCHTNRSGSWEHGYDPLGVESTVKQTRHTRN